MPVIFKKNGAPFYFIVNGQEFLNNKYLEQWIARDYVIK
jgi:hypothetical protein